MSLVRGYPFQLYYYMKRNGDDIKNIPEFFLSTNLATAQREHSDAKPVKVTTLIKLYGHSYTHKLLRRYGSMWICLEGSIYYSIRKIL